ncbi:hypothetical protein BHC44_04930 [Snodgrassella alvi]|nr:hypothetical protein BHC44_04930 [Snodgrassella alvi]
MSDVEVKLSENIYFRMQKREDMARFWTYCQYCSHMVMAGRILKIAKLFRLLAGEFFKVRGTQNPVYLGTYDQNKFI